MAGNIGAGSGQAARSVEKTSDEMKTKVQGYNTLTTPKDPEPRPAQEQKSLQISS